MSGLKKWRELIAIDERTLALFRIAIAITVLVDLSTFWPELHLFLTDEGMYPRWMSLTSKPIGAFSLFYINGSDWFAQLLFVITTMAAVALLMGYYTRIAIVVCWIMIASLNTRAAPFYFYADKLLVVLLFWGMFLPLGTYFSIDRALSRNQSFPKACVSPASLAILLQMAYLYTMGALLKTGTGWHDNTAITVALSILQYRSPYTTYLAQFPAITSFLTAYVYHLELYAFIFFFIPIFNAQIRLIMFVLLAAMHCGFSIFLHIGYFPLVSIAGLTIFVPTLFWERVSALFNRNHAYDNVIMYYDGDCEFCKKTCLIIREFSALRNTGILPAQSQPHIYQLLLKENSWIVKTHKGQLLLRWDAVAYFWLYSPLFWPLGVLFSLPFMKPLGRLLYGCIARNRKSLGKLTEIFLPYRQNAAHKMHVVTACIVAFLTSVTLIINVKNIESFKSLPIPQPIVILANFTGLSQIWNMFKAPSPYSLWAVVEGKLADNQSVDLLYHRVIPPSYAIPTLGAEAFPNLRWGQAFFLYDWNKYGPVYGQAACSQWNQSHDIQLNRVIVTLFRQDNLLDKPKKTWPVSKKYFLNYICH